jgi:hypothetical protein
MKNQDKNNKPITNKESVSTNDHTGTDNDADKTGTDTGSDKTKTGNTEKESNRFDKPKREIDPDRTGIDINSDKTKKEAK